jgi:cold shock CspA family protein
MTGTITQLQRDRGFGSVVGEDGKTYFFRRNAVRDCWFHDLSEGASVTFEPGKAPRELDATLVRLVRSSA